MVSRSPAQSTLRLHVGSGGWTHLVEFVFQTIQHPPGCRERVVAGHGVRVDSGRPRPCERTSRAFPGRPVGPRATSVPRGKPPPDVLLSLGVAVNGFVFISGNR